MVENYPVSFILYENNGTTLAAGVRVTAFNTTTGERLPYTAEVETNALGEAIIDLFNFPSHYSNSDNVQIVAFIHKKSIEVRHTIDTTVGSFEPTNMILHWGGAYLNDIKVISLTVANSDTITKYVDFYDRATPEAKIERVEVPNGETRSINFGDEGQFFKGGLCKDLETRVANRLTVTIKQPKLNY